MAIRAYYAKLNNMGDLLNEYIIPKVTGKEVVHCPNVQKFDVMGIGSCCESIWMGSRDQNLKRAAKDVLKGIACALTSEPCAVWGTGFMRDYSARNMKLIRKNVSFIAVRGQLSKKTIEHSLGHEIQPVLCDGGILTSVLFDQPIEKKYAVGFVPHFREHDLCRSNGLWSYFENELPDAKVINLRDDPLSVMREIAECETIVSSSLHGCIVADSFHVPNVRIRISDIPGTGFKFDDYYSAFGLSVPACIVSSASDVPDMNEIVKKYRISPDAVEQKKTEMAECLKNYIDQHGL